MKKIFVTIDNCLIKLWKIFQILMCVGASAIIILYIYSVCVKPLFPKYNVISKVSENDSLAIYKYFDKHGYLNVKNNEVVISARKNDYEKAWLFSQGLAAVMKDGKIGFINEKNEVVIPFEFRYSYQNRCYIFEGGRCVVSYKDGKMGIIDTAGRCVLEPVYDIIQSFPDCIFLVKDGKKWQVDLDGNIVQPFLYDCAEILQYPVGIDESGKVRYELSDYLKYRVLERYGVMNRITGKVLIPAIYADVDMLSKELFEVRCTRNDDWFLIDVNGNVVK
jgi:hypothetical protein